MKEELKKYFEYFKDECKDALNDLKSKKTFYKQIPNLLTVFRAVVTIPINVFFFTGNIIAALSTCTIAAITDLFDGKIARKYDIQSQFGADLDAICDKLLIGGIALPIIIQNPIMIINVLLEGAISLTNIKAKLKGKNTKSEMIGKIKTWVLSITVLLGYLPPLLNFNVSFTNAFLATIPAIFFQVATLIKYLKINHKYYINQEYKFDDNEKEYVSIEIDSKAKEKVLEKDSLSVEPNDKDIQNTSTTKKKITELQNLKQELVQSTEDKEKAKIYIK